MRWGHEEWGIVATIDPIDANNADSSTDEIDMSKWSELMAIVQLGVINASATFDFKLQYRTTSGGSGTDITGKAITQLTGAGSDGAKQAIISLREEELMTLAQGARYVVGVMANSAHSQLAAVLILGRAKRLPATDDDLSSVDEVVT